MAKKHRFQQYKREAERKTLEQFDSSEYAKFIGEKVSEVLRWADTMASLAIDVAEYGNLRNAMILRRLLLIYFVSATYRFDDKKRNEIKGYLSVMPLPKLKDVLEQVFYITMWETASDRNRQSKLQHNPGLEGDHYEVIEGYQAQAFEYLVAALKQWKKEGIALHKIDRNNFM